MKRALLRPALCVALVIPALLAIGCGQSPQSVADQVPATSNDQPAEASQSAKSESPNTQAPETQEPKSQVPESQTTQQNPTQPTGVQVALGDSPEEIPSAIPQKVWQADMPLISRRYWKDVGQNDWPMWCGSPSRNNAPDIQKLPTEWDVETGKNIKWSVPLGTQTYGNPVIANGQVYVGTNNGAGYLKRYPPEKDLGVLVCFEEKTGKFLWQHSSEKLPTERVHDWPRQGICCSPLVEGQRLWFVTSRGEVRCLDTQGFRDGENDGPFQEETHTSQDEADVIWVLDMMGELGVSQHNMCSCSVCAIDDVLLVNTSNGLDASHINLPAPDAPSFIAVDKNTGKVLWTDKSPATNILHGQWSSPAYGVLGGVSQAIFAAGDGYVYSFDPKTGNLLWKFDANPKDSVWILGGRGTRNNIISTPVIYKGLVYVVTGQDPEHGEGVGNLWCLDPTKRGDVSPELVYNAKDNFTSPIAHKRLKAEEPEKGDKARANPNSAAVWRYSGIDLDNDGELAFEETMHRSIGTVSIKDDLLYIADFSGLVHCVDAKTGKRHWFYDMFAASWGSALIAGGHVYIGDEDGDIAIFKHSADPQAAEPIREINVGNAVYTSPVAANGRLYIANKSRLFSIEEGAQSDPAEDQ